MPRYIDADKLLESGLRFRDGINDDGLLYAPFVAVLKSIKEMPTADVEEVKHATWECTDESDNVWECSGKDGCGEQYMFIEGTPEDNKYKRCPNCGARMDGKVKNEKQF